VSLRQAAEEIVAHLKTTYAKPHTIVRVNENAFSHLDLASYRQYQGTMERVGYRFLSDLEIVEINKAPTNALVPTMIRCMVSADGHTCAGYYQARHKLPWLILNLFWGILTLRFIFAPKAFGYSLRTKHCYDFESEIAGTFVTTSNAEDAAAFTRPSSIDAKYFGYGTSVTDVRTAHEARLAAALRRAGTSASPTRISTHEDMKAMQARLKQAKDAHRIASGGITESEFLAIAGGNSLLARAVFEEVKKILAEQPLSPADA
jgi:hypothetical protein